MLTTALLLVALSASTDEALQSCRQLDNVLERLACYDEIPAESSGPRYLLVDRDPEDGPPTNFECPLRLEIPITRERLASGWGTNRLRPFECEDTSIFLLTLKPQRVGDDIELRSRISVRVLESYDRLVDVYLELVGAEESLRLRAVNIDAEEGRTTTVEAMVSVPLDRWTALFDAGGTTRLRITVDVEEG